MNEFRWLGGRKGALKLQTVASAFTVNRMKEASDFYQKKIFNFDPILSSRSNYIDINYSDLEYALKPKDSYFNFESLKFKEIWYKQIDSLDLFSSTKNNFHFYSSESDALKIQEFDEAIKLLKMSNSWLAEMFDKAIYEICPVKDYSNYRLEFGCSDFRLIGSIFTSLKPKPNSILKLSVSLAHELGHNIFMYYQAGQDPILPEYQNISVYSGIRKTKRGIYGALHAAVALFYMIVFCEGVIKKDLVILSEKREVQNWSSNYRQALSEGLKHLSPDFMTDFGKLILKDLSTL